MHIAFRGSILQRLRLASGLILFAFAATHFANHTVGLFGLEALHAVQDVRTAITRSLPVTVVLAAALTVHVALGLYKLAVRKSLQMPAWEALQIATGIAIPFLLLPHIVNTRVAHDAFGVNDTYLYELYRMWPDSVGSQSVLLLLVWTHGCIGLHYWLRLTEGYAKFRPLLLAVAIGLPVLALAGFIVASVATAEIMRDPQAYYNLRASSRWPSPTAGATMAWLRDVLPMAFAVMLALVVAVHLLRFLVRWLSRRALRITYVDGPTIALKPGITLLELSRSMKIPHASVCGGRGRCSTCRVRVLEGLDTLPPPSGAEAITLRSIEAPANVRLACQIRPTTSLTVSPVSAPATPAPIRLEFIEIKEIVAGHVRATLSRQLVDLPTSDPQVLSDWLVQNISYALPMAPAKLREFALIGARVEYLLGEPAAVLVYQAALHQLDIFVVPSVGGRSTAVRGRRNGYSVLAWSAGDLTYFAVSDVPASMLEEIEEYLNVAEAA